MTSKSIVFVSVIILVIIIPLTIIIIQYSYTESTKMQLSQDGTSIDAITKDTNNKYYINISQMLKSKNHSESITDNVEFYSTNKN